VERVPVESSVIAEVGYNASSRTLEIEFRSGAIYLYYFVPQDGYDALMASDNKSVYFNKQIKGVFEHYRIGEPYPDSLKPARKAKAVCDRCHERGAVAATVSFAWLERPYHFCSLVCLRDWVNEEWRKGSSTAVTPEPGSPTKPAASSTSS
jgi:hypothetical protein